ncbi:MAG: hypothetical protein ABEJ74_03745 [Haloferacaceae archaeon]
MSPPILPSTTPELGDETVTYESVRVVIVPESPRHFTVKVSTDDEPAVHAVEHVVVNTAEVVLDSSIWFIDVDLDVGIPLAGHGETAWVWA